jgi:signal transduction histidine kinase
LLWVAEQEVWMFSGLPPLHAVGDIKEMGVSLRDLHFHLGVADYLIAHQAANISLGDALRKNEELQQTSATLERTLKELRATQNALVQQERFKALGEMVSGIAHDFGNLLVPIMTYSSILKEEPDIEAEELQQFVDVMYTASTDAADLLERLRHLYKPELGSIAHTPFELTQVIEDALALAVPRWASGARTPHHAITVERDLPMRFMMRGSESEVRQALLNVLVNAGDAMPAGGTLSVALTSEGDEVMIQIQDTGVGMTDAVLAFCRDPLFSTKGVRGTGLGLAMVSNCVMRHGGRLSVSSELGVGTVITLVLHRALADGTSEVAPKIDVSDTPPPAAVPLPPESAADSMVTAEDLERTAGLRILLVDDDESVLNGLKRAADEFRLTSESANDGTPALQTFEAEPFDIVIADVDMPGLRGDELAHRIHQIAPNTVLVLYTGRPESVSITALPIIAGVLSKPMEAGQVIRRALGHWTKKQTP